jgi:hypothetical protein
MTHVNTDRPKQRQNDTFKASTEELETALYIHVRSVDSIATSEYEVSIAIFGQNNADPHDRATSEGREAGANFFMLCSFVTDYGAM